jgi:hypothetical protein
MALEFHPTMDPDSMDIIRNGMISIGMFLKHKGSEPKIRFNDIIVNLTFSLAEMQEILKQFEDFVKPPMHPHDRDLDDSPYTDSR